MKDKYIVRRGWGGGGSINRTLLPTVLFLSYKMQLFLTVREKGQWDCVNGADPGLFALAFSRAAAAAWTRKARAEGNLSLPALAVPV